MQKLEELKPGRTYKIIQHGNGNDPIFFENLNRIYFKKLIERHLHPVCKIKNVQLENSRVELIIGFLKEEEIPIKFQGKLHLPLSNMFNSYAKSINKRYNRKGSLFRVRFDRIQI